MQRGCIFSFETVSRKLESLLATLARQAFLLKTYLRKKTSMISDSRPSSSLEPLYSPGSPVLRVLVVAFIAGFVVLHRGLNYLFQSKSATVERPAEEANARLVHGSIRE
jgi:hypothetical protein